MRIKLAPVIGQLSFYFLDGRLLGMRDSLPVRFLAAAGAIPVISFPRDASLRTWQKLYWEFAISLNLFAFPYLYLLNGMNKYWYVSIVFIGVAFGFLAKAIFMIPLSAITFVAAALAFSYFHGPVQAEIHIVDGGHFALDTAADLIAQLVRGFLK